MVLDAASLEAIIQEIRACFLYEDAPDHLTVLEQGIEQLRSSDHINFSAQYNALMRAAHSLKGGSGLAQLSTLSRLAHKLEDLLEALHQGRVQQQEFAYELLAISVQQIRSLIADSTSGDPVVVETNLLPAIATLENFLVELPPQQSNLKVKSNQDAPEINFWQIALEVDLEKSLQKVERLLDPDTLEATALHQALITLAEECTLLGQALNLPWLNNTANVVTNALAQPNPQLEAIAIAAITDLRQQRLQALSQASPDIQPQAQQPVTSHPEQSKADQIIPVQSIDFNLRIPVSRLDRMHNNVGELFISYERLSLYQEQLQQVDSTLKKRAAQLHPISEQVQNFYELATAETKHENSTSPSQLHNTLQDLQELMVQVQEARADIGLITYEFREALGQLRQQLNGLHQDLTQSRLVPFGLLSEQFTAPLQTFNQQDHKSAQLVVVGKETLIDQVILEQLKIPLTHLIRNAFDHGIETPAERRALNKPENAQITLSAAVAGNSMTIAIADDGRGIDLKAVHQRAVDFGLCSHEPAPPEQIRQFIFTPGFSTAATVTALSGRGVGLDIVKLQVERLRGSIEVASTPGQGTKFTIKIPLTLNILPLLLCSCQQQTLAIPSTKVIEIISLAARQAIDTITWRDRSLTVYPIMQLLPYRQQALSPPSQNPRLAVVLDVNSQEVAIAVDFLLGERELVFKAFDPIVKVPPYISGCTVLGTGEVVPVLSPDDLSELIVAQSPITPIASSDRPLKILIVDDSIAFRRVLERMLTQSGYQVVQCRNGKEALEKLKQQGEKFDLVISDIEMPRLDGFGLLAEIRSFPQWHNLAVVMLTSRENELYRQKAINLGATAYFTKPFRPEQLLKAIAALLT